MKKLAWMLLLLTAGTVSLAQYQVKFILKEKTCLKHDSIFITGTFSNWDSTSNVKYLLQPQGGNQWCITLTLQRGPMRYKFTRGTWETVEKYVSGSEVEDRSIMLAKDTVLVDSVLAWRDQLMSDKWCRLANEKTDTGRVTILAGLASNYAFYPENYRSDSALHYAQTALALQQEIMQSPVYKTWIKQGLAPQVIRLQELLAIMLHSLGNYSKSLALRFENLKLAETQHDPFIQLDAMRAVAEDYIAMKDYENVLRYGRLMETRLTRLSKQQDHYAERFPVQQWSAFNLMATAYYHLDSVDAALSVAKLMAKGADSSYDFYPKALSNLLIADIYAKKNGEEKTALGYYRSAIPYARRMSAYQMIARAHAGMARVFKNTGRLDSSLFYARQAMAFFQNNIESVQAWGENSDTYIANLSPLLAELYKANNEVDSAYTYLQLSITVKDRLYNETNIRQFQVLGFNEENRRKELENEKKAAQEQLETNIKLIALAASLLSIGVVAIVLYRNNKQKQEANKVLEATLANLKSTQAQLIQSEKMASLGELTAGIAHEIQNPLNFVNNFSEINQELIDELQEEQKKETRDLQTEHVLLSDIRDNAQKINLHGKRAADIVKGMLQHSRTSSGAKEPTDINKLADEYLRLAYHGLRAKDNSFNAILQTDFDAGIGMINVIPQEIGRVLLNLITNAFYAVNEKMKDSPQPLKGSTEYQPIVTIRTRANKPPLGGLGASISISDNGNGIPENILNKIFQPFFTTKPTGKGTGLGLSLSYDIVKAHGGELKVETREGEGSEFTILLPQSNNE